MNTVRRADTERSEVADAMLPSALRSALIDLAFGSLSHVAGTDAAAAPASLGRNLAFLTTDALELDLSDPAQRQFGDYELLELIGEGGMGVVYRARQGSLDREVAVKLLAAGPWASREFIERFLGEARHAAGMQHPNIVTVYEVGTAEELHFFSMRLVRGASLAQVLQRDGPLAGRHAAALLRTVAEAVGYAHSLGVLHLDLKPGNVLLDENGAPHVADFGLARRLDHALSAASNEISGTPSYMAPEQADPTAGPLVPQTDVWGLGAILYELVTGEPPFRGASAQDTLTQVKEGVVRRPRRTRPTLPLDLEAIILKCLQRDPGQRYPTARALAEDLARFCEHRAVRARPLSAPQRIARWAQREPRLAASLALAMVALLIGLVATTQQWRRAETSAAAASRGLWDSRHDAALRLQMDGKGFEALPALLTNVEEKERTHEGESAHVERREIGAILGQGVALLGRLIVADASPMALELSPDGALLAIGFNDFTVRWYDTATLLERGRVDFSDLPTSDGEPRAPKMITFTGERRIRVTLDWFDFLVSPSGGDSFLIDLDRARIVAPPPSFAKLFDSSYSADGHFALLRNAHAQMQLWQVEPWQALSALQDEPEFSQKLPWTLGRDARYAFGSGMTALVLYDPRNVAKPRRLALPADIKISAWAESPHGRTIAIGDSSGRMYLADVATSAVQQLPTPLGREVTSMTFSEDDAWVAGARWDGAVYAFDVASGNPLNAGLMQHEFPVRQVTINHRQRLLIASGPGTDGPARVEIWRLPEPGPYGADARRLLSNPTRSAPAGFYTAGFSLVSGLLATAAIDGEVRLWRLPASPTLPIRDAPQMTDSLYFDGARVVEASHARVRVTSVDRMTGTPWVEMSQPVDFATLADASRRLIVSAGLHVQVFDVATMRPRGVTIDLAQNPQRMVVDEKGSIVVLGFGGTGTTGFEEHFESFDLQTGRRLAASVAVSGPLRQFELSADGSRLLITGPARDATRVLDVASLRVLGTFRHDRKTPVWWAAFEPVSKHVLLVSRSTDPRADGGSVVTWDVESGSELSRHPIQRTGQIGVISSVAGPFVAGQDQDVLAPGTPDEKIAPRLAHDVATAALAVSHDGRMIAHAFRREVQLYDAPTARAIGAPLASDANPADLILQLAFSPDDRLLLARTSLSHWLVWPVGEDTRTMAQIRQDADLLIPASGAQRVVRLPDEAERTRLRARDAGPWAPAAPTMQPPSRRSVSGAPIPERDAHASPLLLDLTDAYTLAPDSLLNFVHRVLAIMWGMPIGIVRLDGVDYDIRGALELRWVTGAGGSRYQPAASASAIAVPPVPIAAFHLLLYAPQATPTAYEAPYASVRLHYRDGTEAVLPMRTQREVPGWSDQDLPVPLVWTLGDHLRLVGAAGQMLVGNPRLANPHPDRLVATIDLETARDVWSAPVFFAITAEAVIDGSGSGTSANDKKRTLPPRP